MRRELASQVTVRLFVGCLLTSEIRMYLNSSMMWKQSLIKPVHEHGELIEVHHQGKDFLGFYTDKDQLTIGQLKSLEEAIAFHLREFCPDFDIRGMQLCIFPQVFVA